MSPRGRRLLLLLLAGPVLLTLGLASALSYYSHQVSVAGYRGAQDRHAATIRAGHEADAIARGTLELIQAIADEINARRDGVREAAEWPSFRQAQQARLSALEARLRALAATELDPGRQRALADALVLLGDLHRFLAESDELMAKPLDEVNRVLLGSRNTSLRYTLQLQRFNESMSRDALDHLRSAEAEVRAHSWRSILIAASGLLLTAAFWGAVANRLANRLEVLDRALRRLAGERTGDAQADIGSIRRFAAERNPLTATLARSVLALQRAREERDVAQAGLDERERLYATLVEQAPAAIALVDRHTLGLLRCNVAARESIGRTDAPGEDLSLRDLAVEGPERVEALVERAFAEGGLTVEVRRAVADGGGRDCWVSMQPLSLPGRDCVSAVWLDITERKRAERELDGYRRRLESLVAERTADLERAQRDLVAARDMAESANRAKSAFLANMSHEIRTPMNAIVGMAHLLAADPLADRQRQRVGKITQAAMHLLNVIDDILDFSKIEAGKMAIDPTDFHLEQVVAQAFSMVADRAQAKGLELVSDLDDAPTALHGDPVRLGQILLNFLGNAVKFTERGHVRLRVRPAPRGDGTPWLRFEVTDTGIGLDEAQQARLFTAFQQADASTTRLHGGSGLGLAICRRLAELMGGCVGVHSVPGRGSTFWVELPFALAGELPPVTHRFPDGTRVLVIDDMDEAREAIRVILVQLGARTDTAVDGPSGLVRVQAADAAGDPYAYVFCDRLMPGPDGVATLRQLRRLPLRRHPVGVLFSGGEGGPGESAPDDGIDACVTKPVLPFAVIGVLARTGRAREAAGGGATGPWPRDLPRFVPGQRVLVAEDNALNQEVLTELLARWGLAVDCVDDGEAALRAALSRRYDLVLMDIQMPRMDGLEATRRLRGAQTGPATPVIAVTANAFGEDRAAALAAGMDAHVAKPVEPASLHAVLARWLPVEGPEAAVDVAAPAGEATPDAALREALQRVPGLHPGEALRHTGGSPQRLLERLRHFADRHAGDPQALCDEVARGDIPGARRRAHTLHGLARTFGLPAVGEASRAIEAALGAADPPADLHDHPAMRRLVAVWSAALAGIAALGPADAEAAAGPDAGAPTRDDAPDDLADALRALRALIGQDDIEAVATGRPLVTRLARHHPDRARSLGAALEAVDFVAAAALVDDWLRDLGPSEPSPAPAAAG